VENEGSKKAKIISFLNGIIQDQLMVESVPLDPTKFILSSFHTKEELWRVFVEINPNSSISDKKYFSEIWRVNFPNLGFFHAFYHILFI